MSQSIVSETIPNTIPANGASIPAIGYGTWPLKGDECASMVEAALRAGYRHIDTAAMYENEEAVGQGIRASGVERHNIFLTTKIWPDKLTEGLFQREVEAGINKLGV
ncbi:aldo/keto reductase, partial [Rhizobiaceae bacterium]|nr:aldo/keto reductase [Rhizobiaceae bacterium]